MKCLGKWYAPAGMSVLRTVSADISTEIVTQHGA